MPLFIKYNALGLFIDICFLIPSDSRGLKLLLIVSKSFCVTENFINLRQAFSINNYMLKLISVCLFEHR